MPSFLRRTLPAGLEPLADLTLDARWAKSEFSETLFRSLDAELWERTGNPWAVLNNTTQQRLDNAARSVGFRNAIARAADDHRRRLGERTWYANRHPDAPLKAIAYFSMEFGLSEAIPLYAGGLGVLAGDFLKTASDLGVPVVGIGLLYQEGYFRQLLDAAGRQHEAYPYNNPADLPLQPVRDLDGGWLRISMQLPGRKLYIRAWLATVGRTRLYLLDSNDLLNGPGDRGITAKLYGGGREMRLAQEFVLGIGGWRMLEALGIAPDVCHLNEGHAAFAVLERVRGFMDRTGLGFDEALWCTRAGNVFTTHTPVEAGFDVFTPRLIEQYFRDYAAGLGIPMASLLALGSRDATDAAEGFNMACLALRCSARTNAVSRLHGEVSRRLFQVLYPGWPVVEVPVSHVTNGVHVPSWASAPARRLWERACGRDPWAGGTEALAANVSRLGDDELWEMAGEQRNALVVYARERLAWQLGQRDASPARVAEAAGVLDPNVLTLGFARRFADYKRPNLLLRDPGRLARLLLDHAFPVQIIVAGKAHPADERGKSLVSAWLEFVNREDVRGCAVFLEDYDMGLAQQLVQGVDLWINTPRRPWEACGTSGMKVLANGGLNISTLDGWWAEAHDTATGWAIGNGEEAHDDALDAEALYRLLEQEIVPAFYRRDARGIPTDWVARMRASMATLAPRFSSNRMVAEYLEALYIPAAASWRRRREDQGRLAGELRVWHATLKTRWHEIHFGPVTVEPRHAGATWYFDVQVSLGGVPREWVRVELYADPLDGEPPVREVLHCRSPISGTTNGFHYVGQVSAARPREHYTTRVIAHHLEASTPVECELIAWAG